MTTGQRLVERHAKQYLGCAPIILADSVKYPGLVSRCPAAHAPGGTTSVTARTILRPCASPGCPRLVEQGTRQCPEHQTKAKRALDQARGTSAERGYDARWRRVRVLLLREHPVCADPFGDHEGRVIAAECVDHINAHKGDMDLFWDENNWQPLCIRCNSKKAATSEGRWG